MSGLSTLHNVFGLMRIAEGLAKWFASSSNLYPPYVLRPLFATSYLFRESSMSLADDYTAYLSDQAAAVAAATAAEQATTASAGRPARDDVGRPGRRRSGRRPRLRRSRFQRQRHRPGRGSGSVAAVLGDRRSAGFVGGVGDVRLLISEFHPQRE